MPLDPCCPAPPVALPRPDATTAHHAAELAKLGAWLLASCDAPLLSIGPDGDAHMVVPWNHRLTPDPALAAALRDPSYSYRSIVAALEQTARALFERLAPRWPPYARPRGLGVITDGGGVGFSPDDPCPLAPGWLARQVRGATSLTEIAPFAPHGRWAALTRPAAGTRPH